MKVILMNGHVSLSTQHKLPIPVLGKSQEKHCCGVPEGFVASVACSDLSRSLRSSLNYC